MTGRIVGVGAGGHAKSVLDAARLAGWEVVGLLDERGDLRGTRVLGVEVLGGDEQLERLRASGVAAAFIGVGGVRDNGPRAAIYARLAAAGFDLPAIVHPAAVLAASVVLGPASVALAGAVVNPDARIGADVIINSGCIVEHDCVVGDHCHLGPGARLAADVHVGELAHVGIGASVRQGIRIGRGAVVGAGAAVVRDVDEGVLVVGVPARPRRG